MTGREIVRRTLTFQGPERIALALPEPYPNDFCSGGTSPDPGHAATDWREAGAGRWERTDEWGNTWRRLDGQTMGEVARGALESWDQLDELSLPDYSLAERYQEAGKKFAENDDKFRIGGLPGFPFSICRKIRRMDNFLMDLVAERDKAVTLLGMVERQLHHAIVRWADAGADGVMFCEDWGTQDRLLVRPELWREIFKPAFRRLCKSAHEGGLFVLMHSCGYIHEVMGDMTEAGIDLFQFDQPALYGIENLAAEFAGRVSFWSPVDIQKTLQSRDRDKIEGEARKMVKLLGGRGGGFVAGYYGNNDAIGLEPRWQDIACRAFLRCGAPDLWQQLRQRLPEGE